MLPTYDGAHVAEGIALFTDYLRKQPNATKLTATYLRRVQELEDAIWQVVNTRLLANTPTGDVLTKLGDLVGQERGALGDSDLLAALKLRILANSSDGLAEDVIKIAAAITSESNYIDMPPAAFIVETWNIVNADVVQSLLTEAKPGGVYGVLHFSTWDASLNLERGSRYDATAGRGVRSSRYGGVSPFGLRVSARVL